MATHTPLIIPTPLVCAVSLDLNTKTSESLIEQPVKPPCMFFNTVSIRALEIFSECIKRVYLKPRAL